MGPLLKSVQNVHFHRPATLHLWLWSHSVLHYACQYVTLLSIPGWCWLVGKYKDIQPQLGQQNSTTQWRLRCSVPSLLIHPASWRTTVSSLLQTIPHLSTVGQGLLGCPFNGLENCLQQRWKILVDFDKTMMASIKTQQSNEQGGWGNGIKQWQVLLFFFLFSSFCSPSTYFLSFPL